MGTESIIGRRLSHSRISSYDAEKADDAIINTKRKIEIQDRCFYLILQPGEPIIIEAVYQHSSTVLYAPAFGGFISMSEMHVSSYFFPGYTSRMMSFREEVITGAKVKAAPL